MKKIVKVLALFLIVGTTTLALQGCFGSCNRNSYVFNFLRIEENAMEDGVDVLKCYFEADFPKLRGHEIRITLSITDSKGECYSYQDEDGFAVPLCNSQWYEDGIITDEWLSIPTMDLEILPTGKKIYARFDAWDMTTNEFIGYTDFLTFER